MGDPKFMTWEEWETKFKPITNDLVEDAPLYGYMFETYGEEYEAVAKADNNKVWTLVDGDSEQLWLVLGKHFVNRMGYMICTVAWKTSDEDLSVEA